MLKKLKLHLHRSELKAIQERYKDVSDDGRMLETLDLLRCIPLRNFKSYYPKDAMDIMVVTGCSRLGFFNSQIESLRGMIAVMAEIPSNWYTEHHLLREEQDPDRIYALSQKSMDRLVNSTGFNAVLLINRFVERSISMIEQFIAYENGYPDYLRENSIGLRPVIADVREIALALNELYQQL